MSLNQLFFSIENNKNINANSQLIRVFVQYFSQEDVRLTQSYSVMACLLSQVLSITIKCSQISKKGNTGTLVLWVRIPPLYERLLLKHRSVNVRFTAIHSDVLSPKRLTNQLYAEPSPVRNSKAINTSGLYDVSTYALMHKTTC